MKTKFSLVIALFLTLASFTAHAEDAPSATSNSGLESWYWTFGLGYAMPSYPSAVNSSLDTLKAAGYSHVPLALDLGFYWPVADQKLIIGPSIHGETDSFSKDDNTFALTQSGLYFSAMYTIGDQPGSGLILRGDIGVARASASVSGPGLTSTTFDSKAGLGLNVGAGYGINVSEGTRLILLGVYSWRHIEGDNYGDFSITVGPVF